MTDTERYFDTADIISQNNRAYLKGEGFIVAEEGPFSPSTAKPDGGWGVHGPAETKGGRTTEEEWEPIGSVLSESDLVMDRNTKAILRRLQSALNKENKNFSEALAKNSKELKEEIEEAKDNLCSQMSSDLAHHKKELEDQIYLLKQDVFGDFSKDSFNDSVLNEIKMTDSWVSSLYSKLKDNLSELEETTDKLREALKTSDANITTDFYDVNTELTGLKEKLSRLEEKVDEIEDSPSEVVTNDELCSTATELREEIKNHIEVLRSRADDHYVALNKELSSTSVSFQKETKALKNHADALFTDLDKKLSFTNTEHKNFQTKIVSLQTTCNSLAKENKELKEQVAELTRLRKSISSAFSTLGAIIVAIFIIFIIVAVNE